MVKVEKCCRGQQSPVPLLLAWNGPHGSLKLRGYFRSGSVSGGAREKKKNLSPATSLPQSKEKSQTQLTEKLTPPRASERSHVFPLTSPSSEGGFKEPAACAERSPAGCTLRAALNKAGGAGVRAKILLHSNDIDVLVPAKTSVLLLPGCSHLKFIQMLVNEQ